MMTLEYFFLPRAKTPPLIALAHERGKFGAGGATAAAELETEGTRDPEWAIPPAKRFVDAGAYMIMIESEGITENVRAWRADVAGQD